MTARQSIPAEGERGNRIGAVDRAMTRFVTGVHRTIMRLSGWRLMTRMGGHPLIVLTTRGRSSGRAYHNQVIGIRDGDGWLVVASNGGAANHPQWLRNLAV